MSVTRTEDYAVRLEAFQGPLDLLLQLIGRAEVELTEISLATITEQYLAHLSRIVEIDVEPASEFLVTAATLVELKSRQLAPPAEGEDAEGDARNDAAERASENPASALLRQLIEYKKFRGLAERLDQQRALWNRRWPVGDITLSKAAATLPHDAEPAPLDLEDLSVLDLTAVYARIAATVVFDRLGDHSVVDDDTPIELHASDILGRLKDAPLLGLGDEPARPSMSLRAILSGRRRPEIIGLFLAVLELVRRRAVKVVQRSEDAEPTIWLEPATGGRDPGLFDEPAGDAALAKVPPPHAAPGHTSGVE